MDQPYNPPSGQRIKIIKDIFPNRRDFWEKAPVVKERILPFTMEELSNATGTLGRSQDPVPGHIPPEALQIVVEAASQVTLDVMNHLLMCQEFPLVWKETAVALISKKILQNSPPVYRPICQLTSLGKLYEKLIKGWLVIEIDVQGRFSE